MDVRPAERLSRLPHYLFAEINRLKAEVAARGVDIINLSIGDPDLPTPPHVIRALQAAAEKPENHNYSDYAGEPEFRAAVAGWYKKRHGVALDPQTEIVALIGSKEGIAHINLALVDPGDAVLIPSPCYPVYAAYARLVGGAAALFPLREENKFLPDLQALEKNLPQRAKMIWINYPNNPTGACAGKAFYEELLEFARRHGLLVCSDGAYSEMTFDGYRAPSILEVPGAKELAVEFNSLSKTYNMTGWRLGWAAGNAAAIDALARIKNNTDSGVFKAVQQAGIAALSGNQGCVAENRRIWQERRDALAGGLGQLGFAVEKTQGTFFLWFKVPKAYSSKAFALRLLEQQGVVCVPGSGFGPEGEGFVRFAFTCGVPRLAEAVARIGKINW